MDNAVKNQAKGSLLVFVEQVKTSYALRNSNMAAILKELAEDYATKALMKEGGE